MCDNNNKLQKFKFKEMKRLGLLSGVLILTCILIFSASVIYGINVEDKTYSINDINGPISCGYVGEINNQKEIIVGANINDKNTLVYFNYLDNRERNNFEKKIVLDSPCKSIYMTDLDGDKKKEIIVGIQEKVYRFSERGVQDSLSPFGKGSQELVDHIYVFDNWAEKGKEIIVALGNSIYVLDKHTSFLKEYDTRGSSITAFTVADINGDKIPEIIAGSESGYISVFDKNGTSIIKEKYILNGSINTIYVENVDQNNDTEIIVASKKDNKIYILNNNCERKLTKNEPSNGVNDVSVSDLDSDGYNEIIAGSNDSKVYIFDLVDNTIRSYEASKSIQKVQITNLYGEKHILANTINEILIIDKYGDKKWSYNVDNCQIQNVLVTKFNIDASYESAIVICKENIHYIPLDYQRYVGKGSVQEAKSRYELASRSCMGQDKDLNYDEGIERLNRAIGACNEITSPTSDTTIDPESKAECEKIINKSIELKHICENKKEIYDNATRLYDNATYYLNSGDTNKARIYATQAKKLYDQTKPSEVKKCEDLIYKSIEIDNEINQKREKADRYRDNAFEYLSVMDYPNAINSLQNAKASYDKRDTKKIQETDVIISAINKTINRTSYEEEIISHEKETDDTLFILTLLLAFALAFMITTNTTKTGMLIELAVIILGGVLVGLLFVYRMLENILALHILAGFIAGLAGVIISFLENRRKFEKFENIQVVKIMDNSPSTCTLTDTLAKCKNLLDTKTIDHILVKDNDEKLVDVITYKDIQKYQSIGIRDNAPIGECPRKYPIIKLKSTDTIKDAKKEFDKSHEIYYLINNTKDRIPNKDTKLSSLPIVDDNDKIVGILREYMVNNIMSIK